jgi:putative sigma-54 modulation protein
MNSDVKCVHFDMTQRTRDYLDKKLNRLQYAGDLIVDLLFTFTQETKSYRMEANVHFRWGTTAHIRVDSFSVRKGIDQLVDKLDLKVNKEKEKIQEH